MPKTFDPDKFTKQAQDAVKASQTKQEALKKKVDAAQAKFDNAEKALATAKENLEAEKQAEAVSQAYIDRNQVTEPGPVEPVASEQPPL